MAITYIANIAGTNVSSGDWTASGLPAGTTTGDLIVACLASRNTQPHTANNANGWVNVHSSYTGNASTTASSGKGSLGQWYYVYNGVTPDLVFPRTGGNATRGTLITLRGVDTDNPIGNLSLNVATGSTTNANCSPIEAGGGNFLLMMAAGGADMTFSAANAATEPAAAEWTEQYDANTTTGADTTLALATATKTGDGSTGQFKMQGSVASRDVLAVTEFIPVGVETNNNLDNFFFFMLKKLLGMDR